MKDIISNKDGGANIIDKVTGKRIGADINEYLIAMYLMLQVGWIPPDRISEKEYNDIRINKNTYPLHLVGFVGIGCSFGGKWFGGYARDGAGKRNYCLESKKNVLKQAPLIKDVQFRCRSYDKLELPGKAIIYCFDKDSEILTQGGWKKVEVITKNDKCLSREPNTKLLQWVGVENTIKYNYKGEMYSYKGKNIDLLVTPEHNLFINNVNSKKDFFAPAVSIYSKPFNFISAGGVWNGDNSEVIEICGITFNKELFAYLLGLFVTDGSVNIQGSITISSSKIKIINKLIACLDALNINYSIYNSKRSEGKIFYISRKFLPFFKQFYLKINRRIPVIFKESSVNVLQKLLEGIVDGDGCEGRRIYIGSKSLVDDIQEIIYKLGLSSNYTIKKPKTTYLKTENRHIVGKKDYYMISINNKPYLNHFYKNQSFVNYNDMVYCLTLEKWHTVLVRRNGKIIWCGQCDPPYSGFTKYKDKFNHDDFWQWCRDKVKEEHKVFISEYNAPDDFRCIWRKEIVSSLTKDTGARR